jgi:hypothetical protein
MSKSLGSFYNIVPKNNQKAENYIYKDFLKNNL